MSDPVETRPLFDGLTVITVGGVDVTADALPGARYSSTSPGGFGEASFRLPATAPAGPYHAAVIRGAAVTIEHGFSATGGTITTDGAYTVHKFTTSGSLVCTGTLTDAEVLVIAGGGGGNGGGGGAGGYLAGAETLTGSMAVTVGAGGIGKTYTDGVPGVSGSDSVFGTRTAKGGGGGGVTYGNGAAGGSGGGAGALNAAPGRVGGAATPAGQGNKGGDTPTYYSPPRANAGGGGAGAVGGNSVSNTVAGDGGAGANNDIVQTGVNVGYAGGGGGGIYDGDATPGAGTHGGGHGGDYGEQATAGTANTGGGGGGTAYGRIGGAGGSGIVVVRYLTAQTLFAGTVSNDLDVATVDDGVGYYDVAAVGKWYDADQRGDGLLAKCDTDLSQWERSTRGKPDQFATDNDGRLSIVASRGRLVTSPGGAGLQYWLHKGLGDPDENIDHLIFVLGDYGDGNGNGLNVSTVANADWRFSIQRGDSPYDPDLAADYIITSGADGVKPAGTIYRVPAAAGAPLTVPARCVRARLYTVADNTPGADRYVVIREMYVMMSPAYVAVTSIAGTYPALVTSGTHGLKVGDRVYIYGNSVATYNGIWTVLTVPSTVTFTIDALGASTGTGGNLERLPSPVDAMKQIGEAIGGNGSDIADSSYADALPGSVMVRPHRSWAQAEEDLSQQFAVPQAWGWWDDGEYRQASIDADAVSDYTIDAETPGVLYDVHASDEEQPDYVRVLYKLAHTVGLGKMRLKVTYTPYGGGAAVTVNCPLAVDGRLRSAHNVYATACAGGAAVDQANTTDAHVYVGQNKQSKTPYYRLHEAFIEFTLTGYVPADATVTDATLSAMVKGIATSGNYFAVLVYGYDFGATLEAADWRTPTQLQALTQRAFRYTHSMFAGTRFDFSDLSMATAVNNALAAGYLRLILASDKLVGAVTPTGPQYVYLWSSEGDLGPDPLVGQVVQTVVAASGLSETDPGFDINAEHVAVLDLSDRQITTADAQAVGRQFHVWRGRYAHRGQITIGTPTVPLTGGGTYPTPYIRAGERIEETAVAVPLHIAEADYDVDQSTMTLRVGEEPEEFKTRIGERSEA